MPARRIRMRPVQVNPGICEAECIVQAVDSRQFVGTFGLDR